MHLINKLKTLSDHFYLKLAVLWTCITIWLSLISARTATSIKIWEFPGVDKLAHLGFYTVFCFLWSMGLREKSDLKNIPIFFSISFGVLMEICQFYLSNGRSFELFDILANIIGSILGMILFKKFIN